MSELKKEVLDSNLEKKIIQVINKKDCEKKNHIFGNFLLAKYELAKNNYENEFSCLLKGHSHYLSLNKSYFNKEIDYWLNKLPNIKKFIHIKKVNKNFKINNNKIKPIFIIGVPRCGSTLIEKVIASSTKHISIGEETFKIGTEINELILQKIIENNIPAIETSITNSINKGPYLLQTILNDKNETKNEAITEIYKVLRPGEPPTI